MEQGASKIVNCGQEEVLRAMLEEGREKALCHRDI